MLILGEDETVAAVVAAGLNRAVLPPFTAMGIVGSDGLLRGGYVFNDFNGSNIELTVFAPGLMTRGHFRAIAAYCFDQLGCRRVTARTLKSNRKASRALTKAGFKFEAVLRGYFPEGDAVLYRMLKDECRW